VKKNSKEASEVLLTIEFWSNRERRSYLASLFISFQMKNYKMLCCTCRRSKGHHTAENTVTRSLKKKQSAILKLLTNEFSTLLDECSALIDVVWLIKDSKCWCY